MIPAARSRAFDAGYIAGQRHTGTALSALSLAFMADDLYPAATPDVPASWVLGFEAGQAARVEGRAE